ncbi:MAG: VOC family protein [Candidatus Eiseniibacteriota bacterium]
MSQKITAHAPGTFCWVELTTTDQAAAEKFYSGLFGWTVSKTPMGPNEYYTIFQKDGDDAAAAYTIQEEQKKQGVPPNWLPYVSVTDVAKSAEQIKSLGGQVVVGPMDVMDKGKMVVGVDPTGAVFALWQPVTHAGLGVLDEPNSLGWVELMTHGVDKAKGFYTKLFPWTTDTMPMSTGGDYTLWKRGGEMAGGALEMPPQAGNAPPNWLPYFAVSDVDKSHAKAKELGGSEVVPPTDIPQTGRFSVLKDPQGAHFSIIKFSAPQA